MEWFNQIRLFQKVATGIFITFMSLMVMVTIIAYSRKSGFTHQDMAEAPLIRAKAMDTILAEKQKETP